ncbi:MAG: protein phosphatase CheZ [Rhodospirillales bacterium]|nr:protein phosphatase CheZ [Rhodospirillales bacterium]
MQDKTVKRLYSAELKRLREQGQMPAGGGAGADNAELLAEIRALGGRLAALENRLFPDAPPPAAIAPDESEVQKAEIDILRTELRALALCIQQTKLEISALRPNDSDEDRLVAVTFELDAIVTSTERATQNILDASEKIDELVAAIGAQVKDPHAKQQAEEVREHVVAIFESCNFQDITGQRITKVVNTLKYVEDRINAMINIWGAETFVGLQPKEELDVDEEAKLLNGPQLENRGISQSEIDKLFD